jgi:hypothetical protein
VNGLAMKIAFVLDGYLDHRPSIMCRAVMKSVTKRASLGGNADTFQAAMVLQENATALKEIHQCSECFTAIAGTRRYNADQLAQGILLPVDFTIWIFHDYPQIRMLKH